MKRRVVLIVCALAGVAFAAVPLGVLLLDWIEGPIDARRPPYATVQAIVYDRDSGAPLPDVSVACISGAPLTSREHRDEVKTDADGRFTLPILMNDFHIEVRKKGYFTQKFWKPPGEIRDIGLVRATR
jgi:hypothetical protein